MASLVQGEDSESSEDEINTDMLPSHPKGTIMTGEEEEDEDEDIDSSVQDQGKEDGGSVLSGDSPSLLRKPQWVPPSLLHKRLGDANINLRKNIVDRILKLYRLTCQNLTIVNDNLSRAQVVIEKVNANVKKSDHDLAQLKANLDDIFESANSLAPNLNVTEKGNV